MASVTKRRAAAFLPSRWLDRSSILCYCILLSSNAERPASTALQLFGLAGRELHGGRHERHRAGTELHDADAYGAQHPRGDPIRQLPGSSFCPAFEVLPGA